MHEWVEFSSNGAYSLLKELNTILLGFCHVVFNFVGSLVTLLLNFSESKQYLKFMGQVGGQYGTFSWAHDRQEWRVTYCM